MRCCRCRRFVLLLLSTRCGALVVPSALTEAWARKEERVVTPGRLDFGFEDRDGDWRYPIFNRNELDEVTDDFVASLLREDLTTVNLGGCPLIGNDAVKAVAERCPELRRLDLSLCREVDDEALLEIASSCTQLTTLQLGFCAKVSDESLTAIAANCPKLEVLEIWNCAKVTGDSVEALALNCPSLHTIDLSDCGEVTDDAFMKLTESCPLRKIALSRCHSLTDAAVNAIARHCSTDLRSLTVSWCRTLTDASLTTLASYCPKLTQLSVAGCAELTDAAVLALAKNCQGKLQFLNVAHCAKLTDAAVVALASHCPNLEALFVSYCAKLTDDSIFALSSKGWPENLRTLEVASIKALSDRSMIPLVSQARKLTALDISLCQRLTDDFLEALAENCPDVARLDAYACRFTTLPDDLGTRRFAKLASLDLTDNRLRTLPPSILDVPLIELLVFGNVNLEEPPWDVAKNGRNAIWDYFRQKKKKEGQEEGGPTSPPEQQQQQRPAKTTTDDHHPPQEADRALVVDDDDDDDVLQYEKDP